jgi:hypothetical protein
MNKALDIIVLLRMKLLLSQWKCILRMVAIVVPTMASADLRAEPARQGHLVYHVDAPISSGGLT